MARKPKAKLIVMLAIVVIVVVAGGYVVRTKFATSMTAGAADTTLNADSTEVVKNDDDKDAKKGKKGKKGKKEKKETPPTPVEVAEATQRAISSYYVTTATLQPERKVDILAKIAGEVTRWYAEEGDIVNAGDLLCKLDDDEQRIAFEEAKINRDQRQREFDRLKGMADRNLISEKEYADVRYQYELAVNAYKAAELRYEYTKIRAPFAGVVTERIVDEGENVAVGARLYVLADTDPLTLTMYLPERELKAIEIGQLVYINPDVNPDIRFSGRIVRIAPEVDQRTGTVKVTAETVGGGVPGSFVRVRVVTDTHATALAVPRRGVVSDAGDRFVFVAAADTVRKVEVSVGYEDEEFAEILEGLDEGQLVVVAGVGGVREGSKVKILGREAEDAPVEEASTE